MLELARNLLEIEEQAEEKATEIRRKLDLGIRGISDVFILIEDMLGYLLVRFPTGEKSIQGFASLFRGERLIFTNSSEICTREIFTAAHELGHHVLDIDIQFPKVIRDKNTGNFNKKSLIEYRADYFAACLLMPEAGIKEAFKQRKSKVEKVSAPLVIGLMHEFRTSFKAVVRRLVQLNLITRTEASSLYRYRHETRLNLHQLFMLYGKNRMNDMKLLDPTTEIHVPTRYLEALEFNYRNNLTPYSALEKITQVVDKTPGDFGFETTKNQSNDNDLENIDFESLLKDLFND